jgi:hypothetical protein
VTIPSEFRHDHKPSGFDYLTNGFNPESEIGFRRQQSPFLRKHQSDSPHHRTIVFGRKVKGVIIVYVLLYSSGHLTAVCAPRGNKEIVPHPVGSNKIFRRSDDIHFDGRS